LFAVREMKSAGNIVAFGLDSKHAIVDVETGKMVCRGGQDMIVNKANGDKTEIIDSGKDYVINMWLRRPEGNINSVGLGHWKAAGNTKVVHKSGNRFIALAEDEAVETF
jgi:hypothetical protein